MKRAAIALLAALATLAAVRAHATATITVTVMDAPGEGFNDPAPFTPVGGNNATTLGEARLLAFRYALDLVAQCIDSPVPIEIEASFDPLSCTATAGVLGYGTAMTVHRDFVNAPLPATYYSAALANALAGIDLAPGTADIEMAFNSDVGMTGCLATKPWYYGLDGNTIDTDFVTVVMHEVCHGLGFQTYMNTASGARFMGFDDRYLTYLEDHFAFPSNYPAMSDAQRAAGNTDDPNLHWTGPAVTAEGNAALAGGVSNGHVRMHGPATLAPGSSVHHFSNGLFPNQLMEPVITGDNHNLDLAINLFEDLGWKVCNRTLTAACDGSVMDLSWPQGPALYMTGGPGLSNTEWGLYITPNQDVQVCAIGMRIRNTPGQTITANVYGANGTTRGGLIATGSLVVTQTALQYQYIPINVALKACEDYEIAVVVGDVSEFFYWDKNQQPNLLPFDTANGAIRVRNGTYYGSITAVPYVFEFSLVGQTGSSTSAEVTDPAVTWTTCADSVATPRGVYVHADETTRLSSVGLETSFTFSDYGRTIRANVYEAPGLVRGNLVATGTTTITSFGSTGYTQIPVNALLREGFDYDIEVEVPATTWSCWDENNGPGPFDIGPITLTDAESGGNPAWTLLGRFVFEFSPGVADNTVDLVGPYHGPPDGTWSVAPVETGIVVRPLRPVSLYSVGWRGDVPADLLLVAQVYESHPGGVRGALVGDGYVESGADGMRWHDIPVSVDMLPLLGYDVSVIVPASNGWEYWQDYNTPAVTYNAAGLFDVLDAERNGDLTYSELPHMRLGACVRRIDATGAGDTPPAAVALSTWPNPTSGVAHVDFTLDSASPVTMTVYDVRGRRVATLVRAARLAAGPHSVQFDASRTASGIYFLRMETPARRVTRKLVVMR